MNPNLYAESLWKAIARGMPLKDAVRNLTEMLRAQGRIALMPGIVRSLKRIASRESARQTVVLSVAQDEDLRKAEKEAAAHLPEIGAKKADVSSNIDPNLIGGWRLEGKETLVDASYKKQLLSLYNRVVENNE